MKRWACLLSLTLVIGCQTPSTERATSTVDATHESAAEFLERYRSAHDSGDVESFLALVCRDEADPDALELLRMSAEEDFSRALLRVELTPPSSDQILEYTVHDVRYVPNLEVSAMLLVTVQAENGDEAWTSYLVGIKDGRYHVVTSRPAADDEI
jgi:hypothetical protein